MGHLAETGKPPKSMFNQATPHMAMLATTPADGVWVTTGWRTTEDYRKKTDVTFWMKGREGGEITVSSGLYLTLAGKVGLSRTGKLLRI